MALLLYRQEKSKEAARPLDALKTKWQVFAKYANLRYESAKAALEAFRKEAWEMLHQLHYPSPAETLKGATTVAVCVVVLMFVVTTVDTAILLFIARFASRKAIPV